VVGYSWPEGLGAPSFALRAAEGIDYLLGVGKMAERVGEYPNAVFSLEIKGLGP
jgi:hypothetical protein